MSTHYERAQGQIKVLLDSGLLLTSDETTEINRRALEADKKEYEDGLAAERAFIEASLVDFTLDNPKRVITVICPTCKEKFQTNYKFQRYCSVECLSTGVLRRGLKWDPEKSEVDRWHGLPPTTIRPETLKQLLVWAREIVKQDEYPVSPIERQLLRLEPYVYSAALPGEPPGPPPPDVPEDES